MNILQERKKKGVSQSEVAKFLNISQSNYSKYERGEIEPDLSTLIKLADYFDVSIDYLLGHTVPYLINKSEFSNKQLNVIEELKTLDNDQCNSVVAYMKGLKDEKNNFKNK